MRRVIASPSTTQGPAIRKKLRWWEARIWLMSVVISLFLNYKDTIFLKSGTHSLYILLARTPFRRERSEGRNPNQTDHNFGSSSILLPKNRDGMHNRPYHIWILVICRYFLCLFLRANSLGSNAICSPCSREATPSTCFLSGSGLQVFSW